MVLLWKDPEGKSIITASTKSQAYAANSKDMQKIATLEKKISERDNVIVLLKDEISMLKGSCTGKPFKLLVLY